MRFGKCRRSKRFYLLISFGFVLILFFFSHWKTFKILDQTNDKSSLLIQEKYLKNRGSETEEETKDEKCRSENGVQTLGHCMNKGDAQNQLYLKLIKLTFYLYF